MGKNIYVFAEQRDGKVQRVALELLGKARELADTLGQQVVAILAGDNISGEAKDLIKRGADKVVIIDDPALKEYLTEPYAKAVTAAIQKYEPEIVLFGATSIGRDLAPRVSARIHTGLTADCTALEIDPETKLLQMTRPAFGGNIMATIVCEKHRPQMATVRPGVMEMMAADDSRDGEIKLFVVPFGENEAAVKIREVVRETKKTEDITEAKMIVSGGRGMGCKDNLSHLKNLAEALGASVAASRAVVDAGWIDKERQVGQTGKTVRPDLYLACGISGAIQHVAGMEDAEFIIALNTDAKAPIFKTADLGIVGDACEILPKLTEKIKAYKAE
ncbi:MAG: electron transfer flavoprotein subunit alpha/FixB family protein [Eubacterium sp.]|nr:electron transfer flavoprotein subunit alpha/FixB family protein [Eubacterium sp.]